MAEQKNITNVESGGDATIAKAKDFWTRNSKVISIIFVLVVVLGGGWLVYSNFIQKPKEKKAQEKIFKAEEFFRMDSINLALDGNAKNPGFLKIIKDYGGTKAGNMARFYAGACYIKLDQNDKAIKMLKEFDTDVKQVQARAYKLLADAYGDSNKPADAFTYYKKAATTFEQDEASSAEALFNAAYLAQTVLNKPNDAIDLFTELKEKFPRTQQGFEADKYLAQLGKYNIN